jgi:hypothetical protein
MRANLLSSERRQRLDEVGFAWDPHNSAWEEGLRHLTSYKEREGHCNVPQLYRQNGFRLGSWVAEQRGNADTLSSEHRQRLDELGFVWKQHESAWEEGLRHLTSYKKREGHCRVPTKHRENGYPVGQWVITQRSQGLFLRNVVAD